MRFQKFRIEANPNLIYDDALTEWENMQANGYDRIWDCGQRTYALVISHPPQ